MSEAPAGAMVISGADLSNSNVAAYNHIEGDLIQTTIINTYLNQPPEVDPLPAALERFAALPLASLPAPAALPPQSRMPLSRMAQFVGRDAELLKLAALVAGGPAPVAIAGLGGAGKTALAAEFVHRYGAYFAGGVFWINAADPDAVAAEVALCGGADCLALFSAADNLPLEEQVKRVQARWKEELPRLLVFDSASEEVLRAWRPTSGGSRVLITSRDTNWSAASAVAEVALDVLGPAESVVLLQTIAPRLAEADAAAIAEELGRLPLALHLAAGFLAAYPGIDASAYLGQLRAPDLLAHPSLTGRGNDWLPTGHERDVGRTFAVSYAALDAAAPIDALARTALARAACLAPGAPFPRAMLIQTLPKPADPLDAEDAIRRLGDVGLVDMSPQGDMVINRLVARFIRSQEQDPAAQLAVEHLLRFTAEQINRIGYPTALIGLQPHLRWVTAAALERGDEAAAKMADSLAGHLYALGDSIAARPLFEQALAIRERILGPQHADTAMSLNNVAIVLVNGGEFAAARAMYERALAIQEDLLGPQHADIAALLINLANVMRHQNDSKAARPLYERALAIREAALGPDDPLTARSLNALGLVLHEQGDDAAAQALFERALAIQRAALGPNHPEIAQTLINQGDTCRHQGDYTAARRLYEQAAAIRETALGREHPATSQALERAAAAEREQESGPDRPAEKPSKGRKAARRR